MQGALGLCCGFFISSANKVGHQSIFHDDFDSSDVTVQRRSFAHEMPAESLTSFPRIGCLHTAMPHKAAVPAAPKPGDRSLMTPQQKKDADNKAMADKAAAKAAAAAAKK